MNPIPEWNRASLLQSVIFKTLHPIISKLGAKHFPTLETLNEQLSLIHPKIRVLSGVPLSFVSQELGRTNQHFQYEPRCYLRGEVQMRQYNWHDLFNALIWLTFPKTKAVLNWLHYQAMTEVKNSSNQGRGMVRDAITLMDESGVIIAHSDPGLAKLIREFKWKELFWYRRVRLDSVIEFHLFGHGLCEKALKPFIGMTGKGLLLEVPQDYFSWDLVRQLAYMDRLLVERITSPGNFCNTRALSPLPLLGIPGWATENLDESYYDNTSYFRSGRRK